MARVAIVLMLLALGCDQPPVRGSPLQIPPEPSASSKLVRAEKQYPEPAPEPRGYQPPPEPMRYSGHDHQHQKLEAQMRAILKLLDAEWVMCPAEHCRNGRVPGDLICERCEGLGEVLEKR